MKYILLICLLLITQISHAGNLKYYNAGEWKSVGQGLSQAVTQGQFSSLEARFENRSTATAAAIAAKLDATAQAANSAQLNGQAGSYYLDAGNLSAGTVPSARGGAGTVSGILKADGSGNVSANAISDHTAAVEISRNLRSYGVVLEPSTNSADFDYGSVYMGDVIKVGSTYYMFYTGYNATATPVRSVGLATSTDMKNWTKTGAIPTLPNSSDMVWQFVENVYYENGTYYLMVSGPLVSCPSGPECKPLGQLRYWHTTDPTFQTWTYGGVQYTGQSLGVTYNGGNRSLVKGDDGYYYMTMSDYDDEFYSANKYYRFHIRLLRASSIGGPWTKDWDGTDHVLVSPDDPAFVGTEMQTTTFDSKLVKIGSLWVLQVPACGWHGVSSKQTSRLFYSANIEGPYYTDESPYYVADPSVISQVEGRSGTLQNIDNKYYLLQDASFDSDGKVRIMLFDTAHDVNLPISASATSALTDKLVKFSASGSPVTSGIASATIAKITESGGVPLWDGGAWPGANGGDVSGPASSTDNAIARFDSTTGKLIQNSGVIVDDSNNITIPGQVSITSGTFPVADIKRTTTSVGTGSLATASGNVGTLRLYASTSNDMLDGFGTGIQFAIGDSGYTPTTSSPIAQIMGRRDGSDLQGALQVWLHDAAGTGQPVMTLRNSGSVGIGTTSPDQKLDVEGAGTQFQISYDESNATTFATGSSGDLTITPSGGDTSFTGNVGIGTTSPNAKLEVKDGHIGTSQTTAPTVDTGSITGTDNAGRISVTSTASVTVTFNQAWNNIWSCTANTSSATVPVGITSLSTTAVTFNFGSGSYTIYYSCNGN